MPTSIMLWGNTDRCIRSGIWHNLQLRGRELGIEVPRSLVAQGGLGRARMMITKLAHLLV